MIGVACNTTYSSTRTQKNTRYNILSRYSMMQNQRSIRIIRGTRISIFKMHAAIVVIPHTRLKTRRHQPAKSGPLDFQPWTPFFFFFFFVWWRSLEGLFAKHTYARPPRPLTCRNGTHIFVGVQNISACPVCSSPGVLPLLIW